MITVIIILVSITVASILAGLFYKAEIIFAPILGVMVGALYSFTDYDDDREHTLQVCIFFISITIQWVQTSNG